MTKTQLREHRIDEALKESFPASDPPFFVGAGVPKPKNGPPGARAGRGQSKVTGKKHRQARR